MSRLKYWWSEFWMVSGKLMFRAQVYKGVGFEISVPKWPQVTHPRERAMLPTLPVRGIRDSNYVSLNSTYQNWSYRQGRDKAFTLRHVCELFCPAATSVTNSLRNPKFASMNTIRFLDLWPALTREVHLATDSARNEIIWRSMSHFFILCSLGV